MFRLALGRSSRAAASTRTATEMKKLILAAVVAYVGSLTVAHAAKPGRTWYIIDYTTAACNVSRLSPKQTYDLADAIGVEHGMTVERIAPSDVIKTPDGNTQVTIRATRNGKPVVFSFFTNPTNCERFVALHNIKPEQAAGADIN
jgi:hypothetical protein